MKTIFFIRHGLTDGNEKNAYQFSTAELSELGLEQARVVAARFKTLPLQKIIASDFTRAVQTASIIGESLNDRSNSLLYLKRSIAPQLFKANQKTIPSPSRSCETLKRISILVFSIGRSASGRHSRAYSAYLVECYVV